MSCIRTSVFLTALGLAGTGGLAQAANISLAAIDSAAVQLNGDGSTDAFTDFPGAESPAQAIDGNVNTKYLSFQGAGLDANGDPASNPTGLVITLGSATAINGIQFTTANDFASRDPGTVEIYGTNMLGTSGDIAANGTAADYTLVYSGSTGIPQFATTADGRFTDGAVQGFATSDAYRSYVVIITDLVRYPNNAPTNFQFSEVALLDDVPEPGSLALLGLGGLAILRRRRG